MRRLVLGFALWLLAALPVMAAAAPERIPFRIVDGAIIVQTVVQGRPTPTLIDSGGEGALIDTAYASVRNILPRNGPDANVNGQEASTLNNLDIVLGRQRILSDVLTTNLGSLNQRANMILGKQFFDQWVVEFDFDTNTMALHAKRNFQPQPGSIRVALRRNNRGLPSVPIAVEGSTPIQALVDTGFSVFMGLNNATAERLNLLDRISIVGRGQGLNASGGVRTVVLRQVEVGGLPLQNIPAMVPDRNVPNFNDLPAFVGLPFLQRYHVWIDTSGQQMWLIPRAPPAPPAGRGAPAGPPVAGRGPIQTLPLRPGVIAAWSLPELGAVLVSAPGGNNIAAMTPNGRAEKAGLKVGDLVRLIGNRPPVAFFSTNPDWRGEVVMTLADGRTITIPAVSPESPSRPGIVSASSLPALGMVFVNGPGGGGIVALAAGGRAEKAGLKVGDLLRLIGNLPPLAFLSSNPNWAGEIVMTLADGRTVTIPAAPPATPN